jgi:Uma2 family endonuclease
MAKQEIRSAHLTYDDYVHFPDDGKRHEIIEGDHYMTPAPKTKHQTASINLSMAMGNFVKMHSLGVVFTAPCDVVLSNENVVQPDLLFVSAARAAIVTEDNIQGAPDLIIEILSESSRKKDEVIKRKLYERFGVQEYWVVDPELEIVKVFRLAQQKYGRALELSKESNDVVTTALLPGLSFAVSEIFE